MDKEIRNLGKVIKILDFPEELDLGNPLYKIPQGKRDEVFWIKQDYLDFLHGFAVKQDKKEIYYETEDAISSFAEIRKMDIKTCKQIILGLEI